MAAGPDDAARRVDTDAFREVMGRYATGVTVVTAVQHGLDHAMTANSFTSVSLDPPLVLVCVENDSRFHEAVTDAGYWAVNVLDERSRGRARWFATPGRPLEGQFEAVPRTRSALTGSVLMAEALATLECRTVAVHEAGDHDVLVGEVLALRLVNPDGLPLLYWAREYRTLGAAPPSTGSAADAAIRAGGQPPV